MVSGLSGSTALMALRSFQANQRAMNRALERLSTGKRINRASDDPAGLVAVSKMGQRRVELEAILKQDEYNAALMDAADGALSQIGDLMVELQGLMVGAANRAAVSGEALNAMQIEVDSIVHAVDYISRTAEFDGKRLVMDGVAMSRGDTTYAIAGGAPDLREFASGGKYDLRSGNLEEGQKKAKSLGESITNRRASIGAIRKYTIAPMSAARKAELENTAAAQSTIEDTDYAAEMSEFIRSQSMAQASIYVLRYAQDQYAKVFELIR